MAEFDWDDLQYFLAVARTGQLSAAARRLRTNHVTVSRRIDRLEQALAMRLFERSPRGYNLTSLGARLLASAGEMETCAENLLQAVSGSRSMLRGVVRLSTPEGFGSFFLSPLLPELATRHPGLLLEFMTLQQIVSLSRREADISVALHAPASGPYACEKLVSYKLQIYASRDYLVRHPRIKTIDDLKAHPLAGYIDDMIFAPGLDYLSEILPGRKASYQSSSLIAQIAAVRAGYGIAVLPHYIARRDDALVALLPDELNIQRDYWMICHEQMADAPRIRVVQEFLRRETQAQQALFLGQAG
ncbi:LysR family transcriptional regulator [Aureimonas fodinaquatilis]|uniref:LysR family transcriptional regulator n=1 Tax=Aureimonas fodinaquatilis TaxID=2565783 RepID=A0A5B0DQ10_9HYPH|nr:LysR family transcriptional regulator [Aureimonas fodinaquatilis]KAA0968927.1 LysR family transcriptional regulator [Aureimonas fodinaquatilis]